MALPSRTFARTSLALWKRRLKYRQHRLAHWQKRHDTFLVAKWSHLAALAKARIALRERQLRQLASAKGIDTSNNNGGVDWRHVAKAGYRFAWCKASEGTSFSDGFFLANMKAAKAAGLKVGGYHFLRPAPGRSAKGEAQLFVARLKAAGLGEHGWAETIQDALGTRKDLAPVVDVEVTAFSARAGLAPHVAEGDGCMGDGYHDDDLLTLASATVGMSSTEAHVVAFVDEVHRLLGVRPLIYTFPAFMRWSSTHGCRLWIANFGVSQPTIPAPWKDYTVWQHSSSGSVPGVRGRCDLNKTR